MDEPVSARRGSRRWRPRSPRSSRAPGGCSASKSGSSCCAISRTSTPATQRQYLRDCFRILRPPGRTDPQRQGRALQAVRLRVRRRLGPPGRPGTGSERLLRGARQLRPDRPRQQAALAARAQRLGQDDLPRRGDARARGLLRDRRRGAVPVLVGVPPARARRAGIGFGSGPWSSGIGEATFAKLGAEAIDAKLSDENKNPPLYLIPMAGAGGAAAVAAARGPGPWSRRTLGSSTSSSARRRCAATCRSATGGSSTPCSTSARATCARCTSTCRSSGCSSAGSTAAGSSPSSRSRPPTRAASRSPATAPTPACRRPSAGRCCSPVEATWSTPTAGLLNFSDLLKRPYEHYKYLLTATESGPGRARARGAGARRGVRRLGQRPQPARVPRCARACVLRHAARRQHQLARWDLEPATCIGDFVAHPQFRRVRHDRNRNARFPEKWGGLFPGERIL